MKTPLNRFVFRLCAALCGALALLAARAADAPLSPDRVTFYTEPNYRGDALTVEAGAAVADLARMQRPGGQPWTFAISSVRIEGAAKAVVYAAAGMSGDRLELTRSIPDLYAEGRGQGATWDRSIASVSVLGPKPAVVVPAPAPAQPPTVVVVPRPTPPPVIVRIDPRAVDAAIHRAFREVLNRSADPVGLRTYRDRIVNQGWSEEQVIRHLQRSDEARGIDATAAITRIYREVLGRDPDPHGLGHYRGKWRDGWTQGRIRDDLRRSHEGKNSYIQNAITRAYRELLGREPDPAGYANYEKLMREKGLSERDLRASIMSGDEYRQRRR